MRCHAKKQTLLDFFDKKSPLLEFFCSDTEVSHNTFLDLLSDQGLTIQNQSPLFGPKTHRAII